jgi:hypothetical protein
MQYSMQQKAVAALALDQLLLRDASYVREAAKASR